MDIGKVEITFKNRDSLNNLIDNEKDKHLDYLIRKNRLEVRPAGKGMGWFSDSRGSLLYKEVSGNFLLETEVEIFKLDGTKGIPKAQFSSAGLLIRDADETKGNATWMMYNIGFQNSFWGREIKVTRPKNKFRFNPTYLMGLQSLSTLNMIPVEYTSEPMKLRLARYNNELRAYYKDKHGNWIEEKPTSAMETMGNGVKVPIEGFNSDYFRPVSFGLKDDVQVGIICNPGMKTSNPLIRFRDAAVKFTYFKISNIYNFEDCFKLEHEVEL